MSGQGQCPERALSGAPRGRDRQRDHQLVRQVSSDGHIRGEVLPHQINRLAHFSREARDGYLAFCTSPQASWKGNFRDLSASVTRMATLAPSGRISVESVEHERKRLVWSWSGAPEPGADHDVLAAALTPDQIAGLDRFDRVQLADVLAVCRASRSISDAGRQLFAASRARKTSVNDSDRLRKYLARFGLTWEAVVR